ncbi:MAG TPA: 16S rRNA (uracil(1498)-N(3))-methyltransferase [Actinobacteria bacterium]|nr:16S rRNA (uracil(1498)-N(3))-methyltransferase [Actinomycetota bacterium]
MMVMGTHRFFVLPECIGEYKVSFDEEDSHHIKNVLRLNEGDVIEVCNGLGNLFEVKITSNERNRVCGRILKKVECKKGDDLRVTLFQAILKGSKMDFVIQKATEIGVVRIVPVFTERTVVDLQNGKDKKRLLRWKKITMEASKQSKRVTVPKIDDPMDLVELPKVLSDFDRILIFWEDEKERGIRDVLDSLKCSNVAIIIGPEGGFSEREVNLVKGVGGKTVTLGDNILRAETAGLVASAIVLYELNALGT